MRILRPNTSSLLGHGAEVAIGHGLDEARIADQFPAGEGPAVRNLLAAALAHAAEGIEELLGGVAFRRQLACTLQHPGNRKLYLVVHGSCFGRVARRLEAGRQ